MLLRWNLNQYTRTHATKRNFRWSMLRWNLDQTSDNKWHKSFICFSYRTDLLIEIDLALEFHFGFVINTITKNNVNTNTKTNSLFELIFYYIFACDVFLISFFVCYFFNNNAHINNAIIKKENAKDDVHHSIIFPQLVKLWRFYGKEIRSPEKPNKFFTTYEYKETRIFFILLFF